MKYPAVIFDLDGTTLNTLDDLAASLNFALTSNGLPTRTIDEVRRFVGNGIRLLIERGVPEGTPDDVTDRVYADFTEHYNVHCADLTAPYAGVTELLRSLKASGVKTAVLSNKSDPAVQKLCAKYFPDLFDVIVGVRPDMAKKPAPDMTLEVLRQLGIEPSDTVLVGDSQVDIETAANAGVPCISVCWGFRSRAELETHGATRIVSTPEELAGLL